MENIVNIFVYVPYIYVFSGNFRLKLYSMRIWKRPHHTDMEILQNSIFKKN